MAEPELDSDQLKNRLISYSVDLGTAGKDKYYGYGCPYMADYFANTFGGKHPETKVGTCAVESLGNAKDGLRLSWTSADNASGYKIYRKTATSAYKCIAEIKGSGVRTYTDKTAAAGIRYRYAVRGVNGTTEDSRRLQRHWSDLPSRSTT